MFRHTRIPTLVTVCALALSWSGAASSESSRPKFRAGDVADAIVTNRTDNPDGTTALTIGRRLPTEWDTKVGVDVGLDSLSTTPTTTPSVESRLDGSWQQDRSSGAGWASLTMPAAPLGWDKAAFEARVDPTQDQGKVSTTLTKTIPLGATTRLKVKNGYAVTETMSNPLAGSTLATANETTQTSAVATENSVSLDILPLATTLSAGAALSSTDERWLHSLAAEQKLFGGPVSVTGSVSERADGNLDGSLKAGFKRKW
jgi:hypothetical protein